MITSLFSQKNICAALGFVMAITIVWKAKVETNRIHHTASIEYASPTYRTGQLSDSEVVGSYEIKKIRTDMSVL